MNRPTFLEGVLVALVAAVGAEVLDTGLRLALWPGPALRLTTAALGLGYILYLVSRSDERAGRVLLVLAWMPVTGTALALVPGVWSQVLVQLALVWLARVWCFHATPSAALLDLGLVLAGAATAVWAGVHSGSLFLALWCLFLVQALFGAIPARPGHRTDRTMASDIPADPFDLACRAAEGALHRIEGRRIEDHR
ncbi:hypothetical protein [uncultured Thiodictyon sp.]|uniref:hypothetical protein n=1 Tax=uncultured Thiodictyon sp. TaxID=1846217 RepID=UPI0025F6D5C2|nr:hypothetical protein [uncultured Thiodictyon sp.]